MKRSSKRKRTKITSKRLYPLVKAYLYCTCFNNKDPYCYSRNTRTYVIIIKGKICCELCQYPLDKVKVKFEEY